jgi:hypothetical protein
MAIKAAFHQVLRLARERGLLHVGTVSIDGTKIDADASKIRSVRYDRAMDLSARAIRYKIHVVEVWMNWSAA